MSLTIRGLGSGSALASHIGGIERFYGGRLEAMRDSRYVDYPQQIGIETLAVCNASCDFCPYPGMSRKGDRMSDGLIGRILDDMGAIPGDLPFDVSFSRMNEPFLDRRVPEVAAEVNRRFPQASLWFFTNASPLVDRVVERVCGLTGISQFVISLNEHRQDSYERVMRLPFARTVANIDRLHGAWLDGSVGFVPTVTKVADGTEADDAFVRWVAARWPGFTSRVTGRFDWIGSMDLRAIGEAPRSGCWQWFHLPILASGRVAYCTLDHEGARSWGDLGATHLLDIYNMPHRRALRLGIPDRHEVETCRGCTHYG